MTDIHGTVVPGFEIVYDAFSANFADDHELGASIAIVVDGTVVVDLWAGFADSAKTRPWAADTVVNIWSTTKGITALCFAMLVDRGLIDYDRAVADYWPAFGVENKASVTVGMLLSHQSGLSGFVTPACTEDYYDFVTSGERLAAQAPQWVPGAASGYHAMSLGPLVNVLFQRVEGRTIAAFVNDELRRALGLDLAIGLPAAWTPRAADIVAQASGPIDMVTLTPLQLAALANPPLDPEVPNTADWRAAEIPSANGFATARALARLYGAMAGDGRLNGQHLIGKPAIAAATIERIAGIDLVLSIPARWGAGFLLNTKGLYGPSATAFGHSGWGGSCAFADPTNKLGFAYTMNRMGDDIVGDPRGTRLIQALYSTSTISGG